jgi:trehalose 6-phosphate phosphatase
MEPNDAVTLPSAFDKEKEIKQRLSGKQVALFLDYDGTLTPIVERPDMALMAEDIRGVVRRLAEYCTTAIVSGRSRSKVYDLVGIDGVFYAGSHGFDIAGPHGSKIQHGEGKRFLPEIDRAYRRLTLALQGINGTLVEHTGLSLSVHYRMVREDQVPEVERIVDEAVKGYTGLRKSLGKKVFELRPAIDWDKGKAVKWILRALDLDKPDVVPVYLGDDTTDEDAFKVVREKGIAILVAESPRLSAANYRLKDTREVKRFLELLVNILGGKRQ